MSNFCHFVAMDERLSTYALIARAAIDNTVPFLTRLFTERFARLHQVHNCFEISSGILIVISSASIGIIFLVIQMK